MIHRLLRFQNKILKMCVTVNVSVVKIKRTCLPFISEGNTVALLITQQLNPPVESPWRHFCEAVTEAAGREKQGNVSRNVEP